MKQLDGTRRATCPRSTQAGHRLQTRLALVSGRVEPRLGGYVLAVPMRRVQDVEAEVLTPPAPTGRSPTISRSRKSGSARASGANTMGCAAIREYTPKKARL